MDVWHLIWTGVLTAVLDVTAIGAGVVVGLATWRLLLSLDEGHPKVRRLRRK